MDAPRIQSPSPVHTNHGSLTWYAHPRGIFVVAAAHHSPPHKPVICHGPPYLGMGLSLPHFATTTALGHHDQDPQRGRERCHNQDS